MASLIAFPISDALEHKLQEIFTVVRKEHSIGPYIPFIQKTVIDITKESLDHYFLGPAQRLSLGHWGMRIVHWGVKTSQGGLQMIIQRVLRRLSEEQFALLADFLEEMYLPIEEKPYIAVPLSEDLMEKLMRSLEITRKDPLGSVTFCMECQRDLFDVMVEYSFIEAGKRLKVSEWAFTIIRMGIRIAEKAVHAMIEKIMPSLNEQQLLILCDFLEEVLFREVKFDSFASNEYV